MPSSIKVLSTEEISKLLTLAYNGYDRFNRGVTKLRNYTMILLMLDAGLRVGELVQLKISDLWIENSPVQALKVRAEIAKTKQERIIPLSLRLLQTIDLMNKKLWSFSETHGLDDAFFGTTRDKGISVRRVQQMLAELSFEAIGRKIHPHILRHTFATRLMQVTSIRVVQQLLGHASLSSTQVYTHPNNLDLQAAIEKMNGEKSDEP